MLNSHNINESIYLCYGRNCALSLMLNMPIWSFFHLNLVCFSTTQNQNVKQFPLIWKFQIKQIWGTLINKLEMFDWYAWRTCASCVGFLCWNMHLSSSNSDQNKHSHNYKLNQRCSLLNSSKISISLIRLINLDPERIPLVLVVFFNELVKLELASWERDTHTCYCQCNECKLCQKYEGNKGRHAVYPGKNNTLPYLQIPNTCWMHYYIQNVIEWEDLF